MAKHIVYKRIRLPYRISRSIVDNDVLQLRPGGRLKCFLVGSEQDMVLYTPYTPFLAGTVVIGQLDAAYVNLPGCFK